MHAVFVSLLVVAAGGQVPLRMVRGKLPVVEVRIGGRGPFDFLLDTGSKATIVRADVASVLEVPAGRVAAVGTPAGGRGLRRAEIPSLSVGEWEGGPLSGLVSDLEDVRLVDRGIHGILGLDWLLSFDFLIDYERRRLEIHESAPAVHPGRVRYRLDHGRILVPIDRKPVWLVLDTGAEGLALAEGSGIAIERSARDVTRIFSLGGGALVRSGRVRRLQAGSVVLENLPVTILPRSASVLDGASGLLPGRLFRRLYVSHHQGYVLFDP